MRRQRRKTTTKEDEKILKKLQQIKLTIIGKWDKMEHKTTRKAKIIKVMMMIISEDSLKAKAFN